METYHEPSPADSTLDRAIALLDRLVAFDTESSRSNLPLIDFVEDYLLGLGARFTRIPNADGDKAALFVTFGPDIDGGVLLSGHTDVVPVDGPAMDLAALRAAPRRRPALRTRHLRHEGLRRALPRHGPGISRRDAEKADPHPAEL